MEPETKTCLFCDVERPVRKFRRRPPDGRRQDRCRLCKRARLAAKRARQAAEEGAK